MLNDADNRLSLAASAIWRSHEQEDQELSMDGSGELGGRISRGFNSYRNRIIEEHGFTPQEYNQALRDRLVGEDYPRMSYHTHMLLMELEVESPEEYHLNNTTVCTLGFPGHPGAEYSTLAYLMGD